MNYRDLSLLIQLVSYRTLKNETSKRGSVILNLVCVQNFWDFDVFGNFGNGKFVLLPQFLSICQIIEIDIDDLHNLVVEKSNIE